MRLRHVLCGMVILLLLGACGTDAPTEVAGGPLTASGFIEAEEIAVAPQVGGRVLHLAVEIGDEVAADAHLARLDDRIAQAEVRMAEAQVAEAAAQLSLAQEGAAAPRLRSAEAQLAQAQAGRAGACQAWEDARALLDNPQALDRQIAVTQARLRAADAGRTVAIAYKDVAKIGADQFQAARDKLADLPDKYLVYEGPLDDLPLDLPQEILDYLRDNPPPDGTYRLGDTEIIVEGGQVAIYQYLHIALPLEAHFAPNYYWQAWAGVNSAEAAYAGLQRVLALLYAMRDNPTEILAQVDEAEALCHEAQAQEAMAQAQLEGTQEGATAEEIAALEALHRQAEAQLAQARLKLARHSLTAPANGVILERPLEAGELAGPSVPLYVLADLDVVYLTLYLPNRELGRVRLGQSVAVRVDAYPQTTFAGEVTFIGNEAEFPPTNVPQPEARATLVFQVRVRIDNAPDHHLRPGILATATFEARGGQ